MKETIQDCNQGESLSPVIRQLELITKLLLLIASDKDFSAHTQEHQIAILGKLGFRNKELVDALGITKQQVNNALHKYKGKRL